MISNYMHLMAPCMLTHLIQVCQISEENPSNKFSCGTAGSGTECSLLSTDPLVVSIKYSNGDPIGEKGR